MEEEEEEEEGEDVGMVGEVDVDPQVPMATPGMCGDVVGWEDILAVVKEGST